MCRVLRPVQSNQPSSRNSLKKKKNGENEQHAVVENSKFPLRIAETLQSYLKACCFQQQPWKKLRTSAIPCMLHAPLAWQLKGYHRPLPKWRRHKRWVRLSRWRRPTRYWRLRRYWHHWHFTHGHMSLIFLFFPLAIILSHWGTARSGRSSAVFVWFVHVHTFKHVFVSPPGMAFVRWMWSVQRSLWLFLARM